MTRLVESTDGCPWPARSITSIAMNTPTSTLRSLNWPLVLGLGALAMVRPLIRIIGDQADLDIPPAIPIALTLLITATWVAAAGFTRVREPVLTLVCAGLTYGVLAITISAIVSPILSGELEGPLANPIAIVPVLIFNAGWGLVAGLLALAVRRVRGTERRQERSS